MKELTELLTRYQAGDAKAFREFFARTKTLVFNYLRRRTQSQAEAEDAFQETYYRIHKYILTFDPEKNPIGWVLSIARNVVARLWRRNSRIKSADVDPEQLHDLRSSAKAVDDAEEVGSLLETLDPRDRRLLEQRYLEDKSFAEIARTEGMKQDNARQVISRAVRKLRGNRP